MDYRDKVQSEIEQIRSRLVNLSDIDNEIVKIRLDITLKGQEALNYKVAQIFANQVESSTPQELVDKTFRLGVKSLTLVIADIASQHGIQL